MSGSCRRRWTVATRSAGGELRSRRFRVLPTRAARLLLSADGTETRSADTCGPSIRNPSTFTPRPLLGVDIEQERGRVVVVGGVSRGAERWLASNGGGRAPRTGPCTPAGRGDSRLLRGSDRRRVEPHPDSSFLASRGSRRTRNARVTSGIVVLWVPPALRPRAAERPDGADVSAESGADLRAGIDAPSSVAAYGYVGGTVEERRSTDGEVNRDRRTT